MGTRVTRVGGLLAAAIVLLGGLAACSDDASKGAKAKNKASMETTTSTTTAEATSTTAVAAGVPKSSYASNPCPMPLDGVDPAVKVECGTLTVPENRRDPETRMIRLAVARLRSRSPDPRPDPVVQLEGGPGFASLTDVADYSGSKVLDERDLVLWDQRGVGFSTPNLDCPETNDAIWEIFATTDDAVTEGKRIEASLQRCKARVEAAGADLAGYDTIQNAADLADLRVGLGIDEWNLRGISYGTSIAIEALRTHQDGLHSVLLDSVVPNDAATGSVDRGKGALRAFQALWDACAEQPVCKAKYGDLQALAARAAADLDAEPYRNEIVDPVTGTKKPIAITGKDLYAGLFNALYDETLIPALPGVIKGLAEGQRGVIDQLASRGIPFASGQAEMMTASITCADHERLLPPASELRDLVDAHPELGPLLYLINPEGGCRELDVPPNPRAFNELVRDTDVPVLVMAGHFDPVTPPAGTERVGKALGRRVLLFPNAGHGASTSSDCARAIYKAFMDDPSKDPDTSCMDQLTGPTFG